MPGLAKPPKAYQRFIGRFPKLKTAWDSIHEAGAEGPLDNKTIRMIKLGIAIGAMREGAVHSSVRKAMAAGVSRDALEQVVALAAGTMGMPATVAIHCWVEDELGKAGM